MFGHEKFRAPAKDLDKARDALVQLRGLPRRSRSGKKWSFFQASTRSVRQQILKHEKALSDRIGSHCLKNEWIANLAQAPDYIAATRFRVPALLRSSKLWIFAKSREPLPAELFELQGFNVFGAESNDGAQQSDPEQCTFARTLKSLSPRQAQSTSGNGMHLRILSALVLFTMACTESIE